MITESILRQKNPFEGNKTFVQDPPAISMEGLMRDTESGLRAPDWQVYHRITSDSGSVLYKKFTANGQVSVIEDNNGSLTFSQHDLKQGIESLGEGYLETDKTKDYRTFVEDLAWVRFDRSGNPRGTGNINLAEQFRNKLESIQAQANASTAPASAPEIKPSFVQAVLDVNELLIVNNLELKRKIEELQQHQVDQDREVERLKAEVIALSAIKAGKATTPVSTAPSGKLYDPGVVGNDDPGYDWNGFKASKTKPNIKSKGPIYDPNGQTGNVEPGFEWDGTDTVKEKPVLTSIASAVPEPAVPTAPDVVASEPILDSRAIVGESEPESTADAQDNVKVARVASSGPIKPSYEHSPAASVIDEEEIHPDGIGPVPVVDAEEAGDFPESQVIPDLADSKVTPEPVITEAESTPSVDRVPAAAAVVATRSVTRSRTEAAPKPSAVLEPAGNNPVFVPESAAVATLEPGSNPAIVSEGIVASETIPLNSSLASVHSNGKNGTKGVHSYLNSRRTVMSWESQGLRPVAMGTPAEQAFDNHKEVGGSVLELPIADENGAEVALNNDQGEKSLWQEYQDYISSDPHTFEGGSDLFSDLDYVAQVEHPMPGESQEADTERVLAPEQREVEPAMFDARVDVVTSENYYLGEDPKRKFRYHGKSISRQLRVDSGESPLSVGQDLIKTTTDNSGFAVLDGLHAALGGHKAAQEAAEKILEELAKIPVVNKVKNDNAKGSISRVKGALSGSLMEAHKKVKESQLESEDYKQMQTTAAIGKIVMRGKDTHFVWASVGNSRIAILRGSKLIPLNFIPNEEDDEQRIGKDPIYPKSDSYRLVKGDRILFYTNGVYTRMSDDELKAEISGKHLNRISTTVDKILHKIRRNVKPDDDHDSTLMIVTYS